MKEILVVATKGGVGKTTLVEALRQYWQYAEVVDLDHQKTLSIALQKLNVPLSPPKAAYRIYDTPPYNDEGLRDLMRQANHILVPAKLGYPDIIALKTIYNSLLKTKTLKKALLVFNQVRKPLSKESREIMKCYKSNYRLLRQANNFISNLDGFVQVFRKPLAGRALEQIKALANQIIQ